MVKSTIFEPSEVIPIILSSPALRILVLRLKLIIEGVVTICSSIAKAPVLFSFNLTISTDFRLLRRLITILEASRAEQSMKCISLGEPKFACQILSFSSTFIPKLELEKITFLRLSELEKSNTSFEVSPKRLTSSTLVKK